MMGLIEALFDRMADALERVGIDIDSISRTIFRKKPGAKAANSTQDLQSIIERIGQDGDLLTMIRESLVSINRVLTDHTSIEQVDKRITKEAKARTKVLYRDVVALTDQASFLSNKINFLLDATLGLINLSWAGVVGLVAGATSKAESPFPSARSRTRKQRIWQKSAGSSRRTECERQDLPPYTYSVVSMPISRSRLRIT